MNSAAVRRLVTVLGIALLLSGRADAVTRSTASPRSRPGARATSSRAGKAPTKLMMLQKAEANWATRVKANKNNPAFKNTKAAKELFVGRSIDRQRVWQKTIRARRAGTVAALSTAPTAAASALEVARPVAKAGAPSVATEPGGAISAAAGVRVTPRPITPEQAEAELAAREKRALKLIATLGRTAKNGWAIDKPFLQFVGDRTNPVTGLGPLIFYAKQTKVPKGKFGRFLHAFNPNAERRMVVMAEPGEEPTVLEDRPNSLPYRLGRAIREKLPIGQLATDVALSKGVRDGFWRVAGTVGGAGLATLAFGPAGMAVGGVGIGAALVNGWKLAREGIARRGEARMEALVETNKIIDAELKDGRKVTPTEMYLVYVRTLEEINRKPGGPTSTVSALSLYDFLREISVPPFNK